MSEMALLSTAEIRLLRVLVCEEFGRLHIGTSRRYETCGIDLRALGDRLERAEAESKREDFINESNRRSPTPWM